MANANRHIDSFGPKLIFETYSETATHPGPVSYTLTSSTDDQHKYQQGLYESGMTRVYSDGPTQVEAAAKKAIGGNGYTLIVHNGDIIIQANTDNGHIKIKGADVTIDAERNLNLKGDKIRIGGNSINDTDKIDILARKVSIKTKGGDLGLSLKQSSIFKAFAGTLVPQSLVAAQAKQALMGR